MTRGKRVREEKRQGVRLPPDLKAERRAELQAIAQAREDTIGKARAIRDKAVRQADHAYTTVRNDAYAEHNRTRTQIVNRYETKAKERYEPAEEAAEEEAA